MDENCIDEVNLNKLTSENFNFIIGTIKGKRDIIRAILTHVKSFTPNYITCSIPGRVGTIMRDWIVDTFHEDIFREYRTGRITWPLFAHWVFMSSYIEGQYRMFYPRFVERIHKRFGIDKYLTAADKAASHSKCQKLHVGTVLVRSGKVVIKGWNFHPAHTRQDDVCLRMGIKHGTDATRGYCIHAEMNVLLKSNPTQLRNGIMFITHAPCALCARHLIQAQVPLVIFRCGQYGALGIESAWELGGKTRFYGV